MRQMTLFDVFSGACIVGLFVLVLWMALGYASGKANCHEWATRQGALRSELVPRIGCVAFMPDGTLRTPRANP